MTVILALVLACASPQPTILDTTHGRTNVVFLTIDTLRADHLGAYGYDVPTSPNLDALAASGVRVEHQWSTCSWTRPAVGSLLTGHYAREIGLYEEQFDRLPDDVTTLAERFQAAGYTTLGATANPSLNSWFGFAQGFDAYLDAKVLFKFMRRRPGVPRFTRNGAGNIPTAADITDMGLGLVDEHATADAPLYLQLLYIDPHIPYSPPDAHVDAVEGSRFVDYDGEIHYVDAEVRRLLDGLRERGLLEDTLVVVTADHGEGLRDHPGLPRSTTHGWYLYDSMLHVPLILWHPEIEAREVGGQWSTVDVAPTVLDLAGVEVPAGPGRSLAPLLRGDGEVEPREVTFAETEWRVGNKVAVRSATHALIVNHHARAYQETGAHERAELTDSEVAYLNAVPPRELYRVGSRQIPSNDQREAAPEAAAELGRLLAEWDATPRREPIDRSPDDFWVDAEGHRTAPPTTTATAPDASTQDQLRELGYLQ